MSARNTSNVVKDDQSITSTVEEVEVRRHQRRVSVQNNGAGLTISVSKQTIISASSESLVLTVEEAAHVGALLLEAARKATSEAPLKADR